MLIAAIVVSHSTLIALLAATALSLVAGVAVATSGLVNPGSPRTYTASAAAMGKGLAVVRGVDDAHVAIAGANVQVLGFIDESNINIGDAIGIVQSGEFYAPIGAAVTAGQFLITDANGRLIPTSAAGDQIVAQAISSGSNAGDFIVAKVAQGVRGSQSATTYYTASGALSVAPGTDALNGAGALAMTLATPTTPGQDGIAKRIVATTAHAHTVTTAANKIEDANATDDTITFAHVGDFVELVSVNGVWQVVALRGATLSEV